MATREMSIISHLHSNTIGGFRKLTFWLTESSSYTYLLTLSNTRLVLLIMAEPFMEFPVSEENILRVFLGKYFWWVFFDEYFPQSCFLMSFFLRVFLCFCRVISNKFVPTCFSSEFFSDKYFRRVFPNKFFDQFFPTSFSSEFFNMLFLWVIGGFRLEDFITSITSYDLL